MKEEIKNSKTYQFITDVSLFIKQCYCIIVWSVESKNPKVARTKNGRIILLSSCVVCDSKKIKFFLNSKKLVDY